MIEKEIGKWPNVKKDVKTVAVKEGRLYLRLDSEEGERLCIVY